MQAHPSARPAPRWTARRRAPAAGSARDGRRPAVPSTPAPGVHDVEMRVAARAPQHGVVGAPRRRCSAAPASESLAAAAPVVVGEQLVADPAGQHRGARDRRNRRLRPEPGRRGRAPDARRRAAGGLGYARGSAAIPPGSPRASARGSAATTSIDEISGAAARTASSTASSRVTADDGQLLQLPANCSRTTLAVDLEQVDVAAVRAEVRPHAVERVLDPPLARRAGAGRAPAAGWRPGHRRRTRPQFGARVRPPMASIRSSPAP